MSFGTGVYAFGARANRGATGDAALGIGDRGVWGGGYTAGTQTGIEYITIGSTGNAQNFGDLTAAHGYTGACSSSSRGVFADKLAIDYITISTTGNGSDFGDLSVQRDHPAGCSNSLRGLFGGGNGPSDVIDYITFASLSDATDFGDLTDGSQGGAALASITRAVFAGGVGSGTWAPANADRIDYVTIASATNAVEFGNLYQYRAQVRGCSNGTRGIFAGGTTGGAPQGGTGAVNIIDYITVSSTGDSTDFGDLTVTRERPGTMANATRAVMCGGYAGGIIHNVMDYVTIASTGNAADFGDLSRSVGGIGGLSGD
jgi:hypothetical protein